MIVCLVYRTLESHIHRMFRTEDFRAIIVNTISGPCKICCANCGRFCPRREREGERGGRRNGATVRYPELRGRRLVLHDLCVILLREIVLAEYH